MNDKELLKNLSSLKSVGPNADWVSRNREILSHQISNGVAYEGIKLGFFIRLSVVSKRLVQPASIAFLIAAFFVTGGVYAARKTVPGDPLYIAKSLSEKAQLAATFNEKDKAQLNLEFARERVAELERIAQQQPVVEEPTEAPVETVAAADPRVEELSNSFKKELTLVRERVTKMSGETKEAAPAEPAASTPVTETTAPEASTPTVEPAEENEVFSVTSDKDITGIDPKVLKELDEAEKLFNEKNYNGAIDKLKTIKIQSLE